jgi:tetratricopeptide (TPR) repeat protein
MRITILFSALFFIHVSSFSQVDPFENYKLANASFKKNKIEEAVELLKAELVRGNDNEMIYFLLGECYFKNSDFENAIQQFLISYKMKNEFAAYRIAECYAIQNQEYKAVEYLKVYLKIKDKLLKSEIKTNPCFRHIENSKVWINLWKEDYYNSYENQLDEAKYSANTGDYANAFYILDRMIIKDKNRYRALAMRADLYAQIGNFKLASQDYLKASVINKKHIDYKIEAANCYFRDGKYKKAVLIYNDIIEKQPYNVDILKNISFCQLELNELESAETDIKEFLRYYPDNSEALNIHGFILSKKEDYIGALEEYNRCIKNDSKNYIYFVNRGEAYMQTGMYENAVYDYAMALDLNPDVPEVYYLKGIAGLKINIEDACSDFKKARSMNYHKADDYIIKFCD